ncbi:hypothetical protein D9613_000389 [Agrocybe pediades]|uniref:Uncharacterized protein n=1 Tax=Agrocybe pediades TaxID=84607 RepID=A0A8H4R0H5_9AGAR|nr:hypothetical protein D9613_000389 [Agrocybe pediades]KAF9568070.1 hypothetical protein CPC08DRAFT_813876 [Agrocybe pediades]
MSSESIELPSESIQKATIFASLNSSLLFIFLTGFCVGVYGWTVHLYISRSRNTHLHKSTIVGCLTSLCATVIYACFAQWYNLSTVFGQQASTRLELYALSFFGPQNVPQWMPMLSNISNDVGFLIADGLMIWRCYHICGRSAWYIFLPLVFYLAEISLALIENVVYALLGYKTDYKTTKHAKLFDDLDASLAFVTASTSLLTTYTIARQIYIATAQNQRSRKRYSQIIEIVVHSSVFYSLALLAMAICNLFLYSHDKYTSARAGVLIRYLSVLAIVATVLSPTLMVARLTVASRAEEDHDETISLHHLDVSTEDVEVADSYASDNEVSDGYEEEDESRTELRTFFVTGGYK